MQRIVYLFTVLILTFSSISLAHSPWGQYQVYRQKHLLILSTKEDAPTYPFSKRLTTIINRIEPTASARPARAKDLRRIHALLKTNQMQFAVLSKQNAVHLRQGTAAFKDKEPLAMAVIYTFGELEFLVQPEFPDQLVSIVTHAVLSSLDHFPDADPPEKIINNPHLHDGALKALQESRLK